MDYTKRIKAVNIDFELTCHACPEEYDVYIEGKQVAYVRLRWGHLRVDVPDIGGETVYVYNWKDEWKGFFASDEEKEFHLDSIALILYNRYS